MVAQLDSTLSQYYLRKTLQNFANFEDSKSKIPKGLGNEENQKDTVAHTDWCMKIINQDISFGKLESKLLSVIKDSLSDTKMKNFKDKKKYIM